MPEDLWRVQKFVPIGTINLEDPSNITRETAEKVNIYIQKNKNQGDSINMYQTKGGYTIELTYGNGRVNKKLQKEILTRFANFQLCHIETCENPLRDKFMIRSDLLTTVRVSHTFLWDCILWVRFFPLFETPPHHSHIHLDRSFSYYFSSS